MRTGGNPLGDVDTDEPDGWDIGGTNEAVRCDACLSVLCKLVCVAFLVGWIVCVVCLFSFDFLLSSLESLWIGSFRMVGK